MIRATVTQPHRTTLGLPPDLMTNPGEVQKGQMQQQNKADDSNQIPAAQCDREHPIANPDTDAIKSANNGSLRSDGGPLRC